MNEVLRDLFLMSAEKLERVADAKSMDLANNLRRVAAIVDSGDLAKELAEAFCNEIKDLGTMQ